MSSLYLLDDDADDDGDNSKYDDDILYFGFCFFICYRLLFVLHTNRIVNTSVAFNIVALWNHVGKIEIVRARERMDMIFGYSCTLAYLLNPQLFHYYFHIILNEQSYRHKALTFHEKRYVFFFCVINFGAIAKHTYINECRRPFKIRLLLIIIGVDTQRVVNNDAGNNNDMRSCVRHM